ncbi:hypothetical protein MMC10_008393 [Thelotrema lepadinum]|nr:hypothetical protein [Thelotrema lepadinum]
MFKPTVLLSALVALGSALPTATSPASTTPSYPPVSQAQTFELLAKDTSSSPSLNLTLFSVTSFHVGAGLDYAVLLPPNKAVGGREFYVNGTATDVRYNTADILSDAGSSPDIFPEGIIIPSVTDSEGRFPVEINAGLGTPGVGLTQFPDPYSRLQYGQYAFYGCKTTIINQEAIQLFARPYDAVTPAGCDEITLYPFCTGNFTDGAEHPYAQNAACYTSLDIFF